MLTAGPVSWYSHRIASLALSCSHVSLLSPNSFLRIVLLEEDQVVPDAVNAAA